MSSISLANLSYFDQLIAVAIMMLTILFPVLLFFDNVVKYFLLLIGCDFSFGHLIG